MASRRSETLEQYTERCRRKKLKYQYKNEMVEANRFFGPTDEFEARRRLINILINHWHEKRMKTKNFFWYQNQIHSIKQYRQIWEQQNNLPKNNI